MALQAKVTGLKRSMAELRVGIEAEKNAASLAYFQERSEELVNMGGELLTEGREAGWAQYKERMMGLFKAKFPELDAAAIDPNLKILEKATVLTSPKARTVPADFLDAATKGVLSSKADPTLVDREDGADKDSKAEAKSRKNELPKAHGEADP